MLDTAGRTTSTKPLMAEMAEIEASPSRMKPCWWPMR
jgi:signal recognition particle GTPase